MKSESQTSFLVISFILMILSFCNISTASLTIISNAGQEQALINAIVRLADASDGESGNQYVYT